ncbi:hypothetical protein J6590_034632 [Homalodisca vitripennis]|nr:hypothetical protein J6590_034632 [Homalodisca vitripennis]
MKRRARRRLLASRRRAEPRAGQRAIATSQYDLCPLLHSGIKREWFRIQKTVKGRTVAPGPPPEISR